MGNNRLNQGKCQKCQGFRRAKIAQLWLYLQTRLAFQPYRRITKPMLLTLLTCEFPESMGHNTLALPPRL